LYGGAAGGGKSECLLMLPLVRQFNQHPRFKGIIFRRTFPELEKELITRSQVDGYYAACGAQYNDQKKRWTWPWGAQIQFGHVEHEKDVRNYDTAEYQYVGWDEATSFTPFQYEYITFSRVRKSVDNLPAIVRAGTNPGNVGHGYFRKRFVEPHPSGNAILKEVRQVRGRETELLRIFIPSFVSDNTYLMANDPGYVDRLERLPEAEKRAKLYGDWFIFKGQVFDDFRIKPLPDEPPNACHVLNPFPIPSYWPKILFIDWGYAAMTYAGWLAIDPGSRRVYQYREYWVKQTKISQWASEVAKLTDADENIVDVVLDPSAWGKRGEEFTIADQFNEITKLNVRRADNDRIGGKEIVQEYLRWKPRPTRKIPLNGFDHELAERIRRINGDDAYKEYCDLFVPEAPEVNLPKLQIFDTCVKMIETIPLCVYPQKNETDGKPVEDVQEFNGDDPYDALRYGLKAAQYYLDSGVSVHKIEQDRALICAAAKDKKDLTDFYRKMAHLEAIAARGEDRPVKRRYFRARYGR
jgi:Terminase large subunit, T4likevirus-type, N-terminal